MTIENSVYLLNTRDYPTFATGVGHLTHNDRDYDRWIEREGSLTDADKEYGPWLKASPWYRARKSIVEVLGFYSKMKAERAGQQRYDEIVTSTAARVTPLSPPSNLPQAQYGNSFSDSVKADSFQNNSSFAFMSTDLVHVEDDTADPTLLHTDLGPVSNSDLTFDQQLEAIDQGLLKFDHPIQASPITPTPHYLPPSQPVSPHHHQDVDTSNLIPIPSEPPLINSTHTSNQNIPSTQKSPPHLSHISSWKRILKATVAHTHTI